MRGAIDYQLRINLFPPLEVSKTGLSEEIRGEFQQICLIQEGLIKAALAENIFRIIQWNLLKPKNSKTILIVVGFHKEKF